MCLVRVIAMISTVYATTDVCVGVCVCVYLAVDVMIYRTLGRSTRAFKNFN